MIENPYNSPQPDGSYPASRLGMHRKVGTGILVVGLATLAYGAIAFWIFPMLPPNEPTTGRFNSIFVLGAGMITSLGGLAIRETRVRNKVVSNSTGSGISTGAGLLVLLAAVIGLIVAFAIFKG